MGFCQIWQSLDIKSFKESRLKRKKGKRENKRKPITKLERKKKMKKKLIREKIK